VRGDVRNNTLFFLQGGAVWKEHSKFCIDGGFQVRDTLGGWRIISPGLKRIIVEKDVFDCCEKWRVITEKANGRRCIRVPSGLTGTMLRGPIEFCPECGRRL